MDANLRPELSGEPDDLHENFFVIMDSYNPDGERVERFATPYCSEAAAREAFNAAVKLETPGLCVWLCKVIPMESNVTHYPGKEPEGQ